MPEGIPYASSNVTASTGLTLNYVENRVYGYSGSKGLGDANTETTMLEFTTGKEALDVVVDSRSVSKDTGDNQTTKWYFNGELVLQGESDSSKTGLQGWIGRLIIPPYTHYKSTCQATGGGNSALNTIVGDILL